MDPIFIHNLFGIQGLNIAWYAVIMCCGIIAGMLVGRILARKRGYSFEMIIDLLILAVPLGIIGARVYYVALEWEHYAGDFGAMIAVWNGGLAIYGAVIGALIAAVIFCRVKKVPLGDVLDIGAPGLILGQAIGRWGNFVNQEAFGAAVTDPSMQWFPYAVNIDKTHYVSVYNVTTGKMESVLCSQPWHQATFFYESIWNFIVFGLLLWYFKRARRKGNVFVLYLVLYGAGRAVIEGMRTDSLWLIPGVIRISQLLSIIMVVFGLAYLLVMSRRPIRVREYNGKYNLVSAQTETCVVAMQEDMPAEWQNDETLKKSHSISVEEMQADEIQTQKNEPFADDVDRQAFKNDETEECEKGTLPPEEEK